VARHTDGRDFLFPLRSINELMGGTREYNSDLSHGHQSVVYFNGIARHADRWKIAREHKVHWVASRLSPLQDDDNDVDGNKMKPTDSEVRNQPTGAVRFEHFGLLFSPDLVSVEMIDLETRKKVGTGVWRQALKNQLKRWRRQGYLDQHGLHTPTSFQEASRRFTGLFEVADEN